MQQFRLRNIHKTERRIFHRVGEGGAERYDICMYTANSYTALCLYSYAKCCMNEWMATTALEA